MQGVPIKFRGKDKQNGMVIYGEYLTMFVPYLHFVDELDEHHNIEVEPDSISQLCGYDSAGNEVYEGDVVYSENMKDSVTASLAMFPSSIAYFDYKKVDSNA